MNSSFIHFACVIFPFLPHRSLNFKRKSLMYQFPLSLLILTSTTNRAVMCCISYRKWTKRRRVNYRVGDGGRGKWHHSLQKSRSSGWLRWLASDLASQIPAASHEWIRRLSLLSSSPLNRGKKYRAVNHAYIFFNFNRKVLHP